MSYGRRNPSLLCQKREWGISRRRDGASCAIYARGMRGKNVSRHVPPAGAAHGGDPVCRYSRASPGAESTCINATGGRLLRAYPNVSGAALHLHSAWPSSSRPQLRNVPSASSSPGSIFRGRDTSSERVKLRNERGPAFGREMDPIYWGYLGPLPRPIFRATTNRCGVTR